MVDTQDRLQFKKYFFGPKIFGPYSREVTKKERVLMRRVGYVQDKAFCILSPRTTRVLLAVKYLKFEIQQSPS